MYFSDYNNIVGVISALLLNLLSFFPKKRKWYVNDPIIILLNIILIVMQSMKIFYNIVKPDESVYNE